MLKLPTLIALFVCFVYSHNEHDVDTPISESQISLQQNEESNGIFHIVRGNYVEQKQKRKPCKGIKGRRLGDSDDEDRDLFDSLPLTASIEQSNTTTIGNKVVVSSISGANYNYDKENEKIETDNNDSQSKNCDCDSCILEANKKILQFETMDLGNNNVPFSNVPINVKTGETEIIEVVDEPLLDDTNNVPLDNVPSIINAGELTRPCKKTFNFNTRRRKCGGGDLKEISPSLPSTRRILPGLIDNPTEQEIEDNKLYQDGPQANNNEQTDPQKNRDGKQASTGNIENPINQQLEEDKLYQDDPQLNQQSETKLDRRQNYFPNVQKVSNSYGIDLVHNMNINEGLPQSSPVEDSLESQLIEPTRGRGIYDMKDAGVVLLENSRVCYACSSMSDPTCLAPDRRTTVKYCRKGHDSCLTKTFKHNRQSVIIRDCGSFCVNLPSGKEVYSSCSVCHSDLCNGAAAISIYSTGFAIIVSLGIYFNTH